MGTGKPPDADDVALFRKSVGPVRRVEDPRPAGLPASGRKARPKPRSAPIAGPADPSFTLVEAGERLSYLRPGLQNRVLRELRCAPPAISSRTHATRAFAACASCTARATAPTTAVPSSRARSTTGCAATTRSTRSARPVTPTAAPAPCMCCFAAVDHDEIRDFGCLRRGLLFVPGTVGETEPRLRLIWTARDQAQITSRGVSEFVSAPYGVRRHEVGSRL